MNNLDSLKENLRLLEEQLSVVKKPKQANTLVGWIVNIQLLILEEERKALAIKYTKPFVKQA